MLRTHLASHLLALGWREGLVFGTTKADAFSVTSVAFRVLSAWGWRRRKDEDTGRLVWIEGNGVVLEPITLHECRHTFASLMIAAGVNAKALSVYMGHSNISITVDRYGHLMPRNEDEAAGMLDRYLSSSCWGAG